MKHGTIHRTFCRKVFALLLAVCMILPILPVVEVFAADLTPIYLDLAAGEITINATTYTGSVYVKGGGTYTVSTVTNQSYDPSTSYFHIYQTSTGDPLTTAEFLITEYTDINESEVLVKNKNIDEVVGQWNEANSATAGGTKRARTSTKNRIMVQGANFSVNLTLENVWSEYCGYYSAHGSEGKGNYKRYGGLTVTPNSTNLNVTVALKGDNRFNNIFYRSWNDNNSLTFTSSDGNGAITGSVMVVTHDKPAGQERGCNHYCSAIGSSDFGYDSNGSQYGKGDYCLGLVFRGGTVYAGTRYDDNCTAIGAGGNGKAKIDIHGGVITAVTSSTGTAIGGGIGISAPGGAATVNIYNGDVYAYNDGCTLYNDGKAFIPGVAIGGGSSRDSEAEASTVNIFGGHVEATSRGGVAIGAGNSVNRAGALGNVNISGGRIIANSYGDTFDLSNGTSVAVSAGTAIGGGNSTYSTGGGANVLLTDGTVTANGIGGGFSEVSGYAVGTVTIKGGSLNSPVAATAKNTQGDLLFLTRVGIYKDDLPYENVKIDAITLTLPTGLSYGADHLYSDDKGMLYLWLPEGSTVRNATIDGNPYLCEEADGEINVKDIGSLEYRTPAEIVLLNITSSDLYSLYYNEACTESFSGTVLVEKNQFFTYYLKTDAQYTLQSYYAKVEGTNKIMQPVSILSGKTVHEIQMTITQNTQVWYKVTTPEKTYFVLDLTNGHVNITSDELGLTIEQNGYKVSGFTGEILLSSSGYPTSNTVTIDSAPAGGAAREVVMQVEKINACANANVFNIESGTLNLTFGSSDNLVRSTRDSAIYVAEDATLKLTFDGKDSVKLDGADGFPAISGSGSVILSESGGFLKLNTQPDQAGVPNLQVGSYEYQGNNPDNSASLYSGRFEYEIIGYIKPGDDTDNDLHPVSDVENPSNTNPFTARGVVITTDSHVNEVVSSRSIATGDFVVKFRPDDTYELDLEKSVSILDKNDNPVGKEQGEYTVSIDAGGVLTLTVKGKTFKDHGNLTIFVLSDGVIPYIAEDNDPVEYDGKSHSIIMSIDLSRFTVYYSDEKVLTADNYLTYGTTTWSKTDAGTYTVNWYIIGPAGENYTPVAGSNILNITQATNDWKRQLTCPDIFVVINGAATNPQPDVEAWWGNETIKYTFYDDPSCEEPLTDAKVANLPVNAEGTYYYVKATIAAHSNYAGCETRSPVRFRVILTSVYYADTRELDKLQGTEPAQVTSNGVFTLYYKVQNDTQLTLRFSRSIGYAYITMIVFNGTDADYYYYYLGKDDTSVSVTEFIPMGAANPATERYQHNFSSAEAEIQFCIDMDQDYDSSTPVSISFGSETNSEIRVNQDVAMVMKSKAEFLVVSDGKKLIAELVGDEISVTVKPSVNGAFDKIFALIVRPVGGTVSDPNDSYDIRWTTGDTNAAEKAITLKLLQGRLFIFYLGDASTQLPDSEMQLTIGNLKPGTYAIDCYIRMVESGVSDEELAYVLASNYINNGDKVSSEGTPLEIKVNNPKLHVSTEQRVIPANTASLRFDVEYAGVTENAPTIQYVILPKGQSPDENTQWSSKALTSPTLVGGKGSGTVDLVPPASAGSYSVFFEFHGEIFEVNLIVTDAN